MQVGRNNPLGPRPGRSAEGPLDPDLTKVNRDGIQDTSARMQRAQAVRRQQLAEQAKTQLEARVENDHGALQSVAARDAAATRPQAAEPAEVRDHAPAAGSDRIELSEGARRAAAGLPGRDGLIESPEARAERVADLKAAHEQGRLNTPERVDQAAQRLLSGD